MSNITVAIISNDTLSSLGLKYSLSRFFDINPTLFDTTEKFAKSIESNEHYDLFITTAELYATNLDIFLPRRSKTLIIANGANSSNSDTTIINPHASEEEIIELLNQHIQKLTESNDQPHNDLSQREIDVLKLVASGYINKEIAEELSISINTVLSHRKNITSKLGIRSVSGLSFYAMMNGYIKGEI